jgi:hypothetical protein
MGKLLVRIAMPPIARTACGTGLAWAMFLAAAPLAGAAAQRVTIEVRAGVAVSSTLVEDEVANPALIRQVGESFAGPVRARPAPGPSIAVSALAPLRTRTTLDISLGWTFTRLDAIDDAGTREIQGLGAAHATVGVRYRLLATTHAGCGFGVLRYFADGGLFAGGGEIAPLLECGAGIRFGPGHRSIIARIAGQAHRFRTPVLRDAGAQAGEVFRVLVQAGIAIGGGS